MIQVIENFINEKEEIEILSHIRPSSIFMGFGRNTIKRYGSSLPYTSNVNPIIPPYLEFLCERIHSQHLTADKCDSITINEYLPSQSIDWHIDSKKSGPIIVVLSLMSEATMGLRFAGEEDKRILLPRSLLLLSGDERWKWEHCIFPVKKRRYSIVFRKGTI